MSMIIANEWYKEYSKNKETAAIRDMEPVSAESEAKDEKVFE
jgi:hypothetical protein